MRNPPRRERPAWAVSEASLRALEIACAVRRNIDVAGRNDSHPRYRAIAQALLPELDIEATRETTRILGHCDPGVIYDPGGQPRDRNTPKIETRRISDLQTLGSHETISPTQISTYR